MSCSNFHLYIIYFQVLQPYFLIAGTTSDSTEQDEQQSDDVIFVGEKQPTTDQLQRSEKYMLPKTFYFYENDDFVPCSGCIGCDPDNFDFNTIGESPTDDG